MSICPCAQVPKTPLLLDLCLAPGPFKWQVQAAGWLQVVWRSAAMVG